MGNIMEKPLVLIIEDDQAQNQIFKIALKDDFVVETFLDGDSAAARLDEVIPALVVLDLNLPGRSGPELLARIRADNRIAKIRVILATADEQKADRLHDDADLVLLKPVSPGQLKALAQRLLQRSATGKA
jgi:CheY-like chemotaxis protein